MLQKLCHWIFFRLLGWRMIGDVPRGVPKYLFVAVPHTSNWDFLYGWMAIQALELNVKIFVKDVFFFWPLCYVCRSLGLLPVNRRESTNFVESVASEFEKKERLAALITPEGTRSRVEELKSGYYFLAKKAKVPIVVAGPNYRDKTLTLLPPRPPRDTFEEDQAEIIAFSRTMYGKRPENTF